MVPALTEKLVLGTVQFGLHYGINNRNGKINDVAAAEILTGAWQRGVRYLDSSNAYGNAEQRIGNIIQAQHTPFQIISKLGKCRPEEVGQHTIGTFQHLHTQHLYGYMLHHFEFYEQYPAVWGHFIRLQKEERTKKIGFSLYYPAQLQYLLDKNVHFDLIQVPYNVFDQRFAPLFAICKQKNIEVHVRSIFLQGLFFKSPKTLPAFLEPLRNKLEQLHTIARQAGSSLHSLLLRFVAQHNGIDRIVFGVDSPADLEANTGTGEADIPDKIYDALTALNENNEQLILPVHWKL